MTLYALTPISGFISDLAAIFFLLGLNSKDRFRTPLLSFYFSLANWNLLMLYFVIVQDPEKFAWVLYPLHSFHPFIPSTFLFACTILSGRKISKLLKASFLGSLGISLFISYLFWFGMGDAKSHITIQKVPWGYYPVAVNWEFAYSLLCLVDVPLGIYFMFRPLRKINQYGQLSVVRWIFTFIWIAAATSFLPVHGILIYPIGNAVDAVLSAVCVSILYNKNNLTQEMNFRLKAAEILASVSIGIIIMWFTLDILQWRNSFGLVFTGCLSTFISIYFFKLFSGIKQTVIPSKEEIKLLYGEHSLTPTESAICYLVHQRLSRSIIADKMGTKEVTVKKHLQSIYGKVLKKEKIESSVRDKYFQLYLWLEKQSRKK